MSNNNIMNIIDSCRTYAHLQVAKETILNSPLTTDAMRSYYHGVIDMKAHQLAKVGWAKITGENRFPVDDEHREKQSPPTSDGPY